MPALRLGCVASSPSLCLRPARGSASIDGVFLVEMMATLTKAGYSDYDPLLSSTGVTGCLLVIIEGHIHFVHY